MGKAIGSLCQAVARPSLLGASAMTGKARGTGGRAGLPEVSQAGMPSSVRSPASRLRQTRPPPCPAQVGTEPSLAGLRTVLLALPGARAPTAAPCPEGLTSVLAAVLDTVCLVLNTAAPTCWQSGPSPLAPIPAHHGSGAGPGQTGVRYPLLPHCQLLPSCPRLRLGLCVPALLLPPGKARGEAEGVATPPSQRRN